MTGAWSGGNSWPQQPWGADPLAAEVGLKDWRGCLLNIRLDGAVGCQPWNPHCDKRLGSFWWGDPSGLTWEMASRGLVTDECRGGRKRRQG